MLTAIALASLASSGHTSRERMCHDMAGKNRKCRCLRKTLFADGAYHALPELKQLQPDRLDAMPKSLKVLAMLLFTFKCPVVGWQISGSSCIRRDSCIGNPTESCIPALRRRSVLTRFSWLMGKSLFVSIGPSFLNLAGSVNVRMQFDQGEEAGRVGRGVAQNFLILASSLEAEIEQIFSREPNWNLFSRDFTVTDQTGAHLEGRKTNKFYWRLLRRAREKLEVEDTVFLNFVNASTTVPVNTSVVARLKVNLGGPKVPIYRFWERENPVEIDAETIFGFNDKRQIKSVQIKKWLVNGRMLPGKLQLFPNVHSSDHPLHSMNRMKEWTRDMTQLSMEPFQASPTQYVKVNLVPNRRELLLQVAFQVGFILAGTWIAIVRNENRNLERPANFKPIDGLENDIPAILDQEPCWINFSEEFSVVDKFGDPVVTGLGPSIVLFKLLRGLRLILTDGALRDDLQARMQRRRDPETGEEYLAVTAVLDVDAKRDLDIDVTKNIEILTLESFTDKRDGPLARKLGFPYRFTCQATFFLNEPERGALVETMRVDEFYINGNAVELPPIWPPFFQSVSSYRKAATQESS